MGSERKISQNIGLFAGFAIFILFIAFPVSPGNILASRTAAVAALMAVWWMTEAIPLGATSFLPFAVFPFLGVLKSGEVAGEYMNATVFLFLGGFIIAAAMEKWNLHRRISLHIINAIGGGPAGLILGFMAASWFMSMFISNTATAIMMLPVAISVIKGMKSETGAGGLGKFPTALLLGIAYASSIGGIATLVGTQPNLVFKRIFEITFPGGPEINYGKWLLFGLPLSLSMLGAVWAMLVFLFFRPGKAFSFKKSLIKSEISALGPMGYEEKAVSLVFFLTGLLWLFRADLDLGFATIPGWGNIFGGGEYVSDGSVAMMMAVILFILPSKKDKGGSILNVRVFNRLPWEILILFGGGFALARGFQASGLSEIIGAQFAWMKGAHPVLMIVAVCALLTFLTELTSNTATTQTILPILASIAVGLGLNPLFLMIPATISASFAFMLPVATPPNAIMFSSGLLSIKDMARAGIAFNFVGIALAAIIFYLLGTHVFEIDLNTLPGWATQ